MLEFVIMPHGVIVKFIDFVHEEAYTRDGLELYRS